MGCKIDKIALLLWWVYWAYIDVGSQKEAKMAWSEMEILFSVMSWWTICTCGFIRIIECMWHYLRVSLHFIMLFCRTASITKLYTIYCIRLNLEKIYSMLFICLLIDYYLKKCLVILWDIRLRFSWHPLWVQALTFMFPQHCVVQCELTQYGQFRQLVVVPHSWSNVWRDWAWLEPSLSYICIVYSAEHPWKWHSGKTSDFCWGLQSPLRHGLVCMEQCMCCFHAHQGQTLFFPFVEAWNRHTTRHTFLKPNG